MRQWQLFKLFGPKITSHLLRTFWREAVDVLGSYD